MNWNPGVCGKKCIIVQPIESPNTETVNGRRGSRLATARAGRTPCGGDGDTTATGDTPGGRLASSALTPGLCTTRTTSSVTAPAVVAVAAASGKIGTRRGG